MSFWIAIFLGLVQGLTEFLPVSSSGHLTFFEIAFGLSGDNVLYNVLLHFATLLALVIFMRKQIWQIVKNPLGKQTFLLLFASVLTGVVGIGVDQIFGASGNLFVVAIGFVITAIVLLLVNKKTKQKTYCPTSAITYKNACLIGIVQGIAVLPGLSRSGSTLGAGILGGAGQKQSAEFSFLLGLPIIVMGCIYEIYKGFKIGFNFNQTDIFPMAIGCVVAFVVALLSLKFMMKLVQKNRWILFSIYLVSFATLIIIYGIATGTLFLK